VTQAAILLDRRALCIGELPAKTPRVDDANQIFLLLEVGETEFRGAATKRQLQGMLQCSKSWA
jgi:hypothetical protein